MKRTTAIGSALGLLLFGLLSANLLRPKATDAAPEGTAPRLPAEAREATFTPYPVTIEGELETPKVMALLEGREHPAEVACSVCHTEREPERANRESAQLDAFHQGLSYDHGELSCLSCHNADNYDTLRRADGSSITYANSMRLCAQCHGPQHRDYQNGSHGGMTGHWDLERGPRQRNNCTVCHDPHAPAYPQLHPVFPPNDTGDAGHSGDH